MKLRIVFQLAQKAITAQPIDSNEYIIVIKDPFIYQFINDERDISGADGSKVTYENYVEHMKMFIHDRVVTSNLSELRGIDTVTIEDCNTLPNFQTLLETLTKVRLDFNTRCELNIRNCSYGKRAIGKELAKRIAEFFKLDYRIFL